MCGNGNGSQLKLIFKEISRSHHPILCTNKSEDVEQLGKVLALVNTHCISLDGCASSRIFTDLCFFEKLLNTPCQPQSSYAAIKKYFSCPDKEFDCGSSTTNQKC